MGKMIFKLLICALVCCELNAGEPTRTPIAEGITSKIFDAEKKPDKSRYHLFSPTPGELMRDMSTDRPDKTESPYSVDAGHFQFETDLFAYTADRRNPEHDGTRVKSYSVLPVNVKMGLTNRIDLQLVMETYTSEKTRARNAAGEAFEETLQGFGDITSRLKINVWGNDGGMTALAFMPFVKIPTNQENLGNDAVEGGLIVPLAVELPRGWGMGVMTEFDLNRDEDDRGYHVEFINTLTFSHDIYGDLGGYVEFFSSVSAEPRTRWVGTVDMGLTYAVTKDIQMDAGVNIGVTRSADDVNPFVGLSWRF